jgi:hypothetical protein
MRSPNTTTPVRAPSTRELRHERATFRVFVEQALGPRIRVRVDAEGWPLSPGKYGRLEWRGGEAGAGPARGTSRLYAYTDRPRLIARLSAIPGVHRHQIGAQEAACWMAADDLEAIRAVGQLLRLRVRRASGTGRDPAAMAAMRLTA